LAGVHDNDQISSQPVAATLKMQKRLPISVCIISGAEAHRIGRTLESVASWTSEIILVLNEEARDGTEEIACRFGAKVFREPWKGFIGQKNSAAEKATQLWLLNLDADEIVTSELAEEIRGAVSNSPTPAAYEFPRCTFYCGRWIRHGDWYPDRVLRLYRKGSARWAGVEPHAQLQVDGSIVRLRSDLLHYSMDSLEHHVRKALAYGNLFAQKRATSVSRVGAFELWVRPGWRFVRSYFVRLGFLDGWQGYLVAYMVAFETFLRYAKVRESQLKSGQVHDQSKNP
jgi:glycosyltransferase involved in cell wall biosynthesis